jgi:glucose-1-phosphate cytidylyltransferase
MKAVLLAGGLGTRMREETEFRPKPMVEVGGRPVLWHIMKVLGTQGIKDFVICAGYKSEMVKQYFYNYALENSDFTVTLGNNDRITYHAPHDEMDWTVTVADTGAETNTGGRINRVKKYLDDEPFLCTYGDGIADIDLRGLLDSHANQGKIATMTCVQPTSRFGVVDTDQFGQVTAFREKPQVQDWINIGYFIFEQKVFDYLDDMSVLEETPLRSLAEAGQVNTFRHNGFWQPMDTYRESQMLNAAWNTGSAPWKIW